MDALIPKLFLADPDLPATLMLYASDDRTTTTEGRCERVGDSLRWIAANGARTDIEIADIYEDAEEAIEGFAPEVGHFRIQIQQAPESRGVSPAPSAAGEGRSLMGVMARKDQRAAEAVAKLVSDGKPIVTIADVRTVIPSSELHDKALARHLRRAARLRQTIPPVVKLGPASYTTLEYANKARINRLKFDQVGSGVMVEPED